MLWSDEEFDNIAAAYIHHLHSGQASDFSIVKALTQSHPSLTPQGSVATVLFNGTAQVKLQRNLVPLLASYLVCHGRRSRHWESWPPQPLKKGPEFATHHFKQQYAEQVRELITSSFELSEFEVEVVMDHICQQWSNYLVDSMMPQGKSNFITRHFERIGSHQDFLHDRPFGFDCIACLAGTWERLLSCNRHGLCRTCLDDPSIDGRVSDLVTLPVCCICKRSYSATVMPIEGPTARCRALALDGGGVRGLVQLEILRALERELGEGLNLCDFFDLIVGTSVGESSGISVKPH
jgi:hypothetical protein